MDNQKRQKLFGQIPIGQMPNEMPSTYFQKE